MEERPINVKPNLPRRRAQLVLLLAAVVMVVLGLTAFAKSLNGFGLIAYYLVCMALTLAAMILALRDMRDLRRQTREQHIGLAEQAFDDVSAEVKEARDKRRANR